MMLHAGARYGIGDVGSTNLICCDQCGVVAAESVARRGGWEMWVMYRTRHHHCPPHVLLKDFDYEKNWDKWRWAH